MPNMFDLPGKRALITGSSQGIGLALARGLAGGGAFVDLNGRDRAKLELVAAEPATAGISAQALPFDVEGSCYREWGRPCAIDLSSGATFNDRG